jgi:hypothetical protein
MSHIPLSSIVDKKFNWEVFMLFKPKWVKLLPSNLRPDKKQVNKLENLRIKFGIPHDTLAMRILSSPATTRRVQNQCLENFRAKNPEVSEKELFRMVLVSRIQTIESDGFCRMTNQEIDEVMKDINSFDELCDYIISIDEQEPVFPDPLGIGKQIDEILAMEEVEKKTPAENLIKNLEQTYFNLKKEHPDRDEHWLLANTWLKRYSSTKEAKQKGPKKMKFIAYKDTHLFSILNPPESIRGLALFLVYKELGVQQAIYYNSEYSRIMEPVVKNKEMHIFLDKYKEKNPRTWKENQVEDASSYSLYWALKGLEFEQEHPEEAEKLRKEIENKK